MEQLITAILDNIDAELRWCYWNKNQKELNSPFGNTGTTYSNEKFTVRAYSWGDSEDTEKPNFESDFIICTWYKHSHNALEYKFTEDKRPTLEQLNTFLNECIAAIRKDFEVG